MMRRVLKYKFTYPKDDESDLTMRVPLGKILHVAPQREADSLPTVWVETNDMLLADFEKEYSYQLLLIVGTGMRVPVGLHHIGSSLHLLGTLVWHVYTNNLTEAPDA